MGDAAFTPNGGGVGTILTVGTGSYVNPAFPTMAEVNSATSFEQVRALLNRRSSQLYASPTLFTLSTTSQGFLTASSLNDLRTAINQFRSDMQLSAFSFGANVVSGGAVKASYLSDLRTALNVPATVRAIGTRANTHIRVDNPYGTQISQSTGVDLAAGSGGSLFKLGNILVGADIHRDRLPFSIARSQALNSGVVLKFTFQLISGGSSGTAKLYLSNTDDSAFPSGYESNLNTLCATNAMTAGTLYDFNIAVSDFNARSALANVSCLLVESTEASNSNTNSISFQAGSFTIDGGW